MCGGCISLSNAEGCIRSFLFPVYSSFCSDKCLKSYKDILFPKLTALYDEIFQNWHHFMTPLFNHAVAFCHHFSSITFPSSFYSGSMPSDYYDILSNCRRIVPSLFISAVVLYRHALQYLQAKNKDHVFLHSPCLNNLYSIVNPFPSSSMHSVLIPHSLPIPHQICFSFLHPPQHCPDLLPA